MKELENMKIVYHDDVVLIIRTTRVSLRNRQMSLYHRLKITLKKELPICIRIHKRL